MSKLNRNSLTAPFPYHGGKRRWADEIWARFGEVDIYSEPFAGTLAVLLGNPHPANREIVADTNGHICNFWRAIRNDPEGAAYWADYPTTHHDLTARHKWLIEWGATASDNLLNDAEWYDVKAAGWWVWGISNWIGGGWCVVSGDWMPAVANGTNGGVSAQRVNLPVLRDKIPRVSPKNGSEGVSAQRVNVPDQIPHVSPKNGSEGVSAQRVNVPDQIPHVSLQTGGRGVQAQRPSVPDQIPHIHDRNGGQGVSAQRPSVPDQIPHIHDRNGGRGVQAQRPSVPDQIAFVHNNGGGQGVQAQRVNVPDQIPYFTNKGGGRGVQAQRPSVPDKRPHIHDRNGGQGVQAQRSSVPDQRPHVKVDGNGMGVQAGRTDIPFRDQIPRGTHGEGVSAQRVNVPDQMPSIDNWGCGKGVQARRVQLLSHSYDEPGARLVDWFCALSDRLARVITLNRDWSSAVTNTLLQRTAHSPKGRVVGVFLDPPYRVDTGRFKAYQSDYNGEGSDAAVDSYLWAVENGEELRIAYACHAGDFVVPDGWTAIEKSFTRGRKGAVDQVMFSPACLDPSAEAPAPVHDETTARLL